MPRVETQDLAQGWVAKVVYDADEYGDGHPGTVGFWAPTEARAERAAKQYLTEEADESG